MGTPEPRQVAHLVIPIEAAGKKNTQTVTFPGINELSIAGQIHGLYALFQWIATNAQAKPRQVAAVADRASKLVKPVVNPPPAHQKWRRKAIRVLADSDTPRPAVPDGHMARVTTIVYMARGQRGDLVNYEQAVWDLLEESGIIANDFWINSSDGSERRWTDPANPRIEITIFDLGPREEYKPPKVVVKGLAEQNGSGQPIRFSILHRPPVGGLFDSNAVSIQPVVFENCRAPRGASRTKIVDLAMRIWRTRFDEDLPDGAVIAVAPPPE